MKDILERLKTVSLKEGCVKIDVTDLFKISQMVARYQEAIGNNLTILSEEEKQAFINDIAYFDFFTDKYIELNAVRKRQAEWYAMLQKVRYGDFENNDVAKNEKKYAEGIICERYFNAKREREELEAHVKEMGKTIK